MDLSGARDLLARSAREEGARVFDAAARRCCIARDTYWYAAALLAGGDAAQRALALELCAALEPEDATHTPATLLAMLHAFGAALPDGLRARMAEQLRPLLVDAACVDWHDGNVNHPLAAWCACVLGGELLGEPWAVGIGRRRLARLRAATGDRRHRLRRQAELSEYHSPTYTALDLCFLALAGEHARDARSRALALFLEQRLWIDVALHWHPATRTFAGPHARSYLEDSLGGFSGLHCALAAATGRGGPIDMDLPRRCAHPSALLQNGLIAITPFHFPRQAAALLRDKPAPLQIRRTTYGESYHENDAAAGFDDDLYPGGWADLTTYLAPEFTLGTASRPYVNAGHADSVMLRYRRRDPVERASDQRSLFTRAVFGETVIGRPAVAHTTGVRHDGSFIPEEGRCAVFQDRARAIVLYAPKRSGRGAFTSFHLDLVIGGTEPFDRLLVGWRDADVAAAAGPDGARYDATPVLWSDGAVHAAVLPLRPRPAPEGGAMRLRARDGCLLLSIANHEGPPRVAAREELERWRNGFVLEVAGAGDDAQASFEAFARRIRSTPLLEEVDAAGVRSVRYGAGGDEMLFVCDPVHERILERSIGGRLVVTTHLHYDGGEGWEHLLPATLFGREAWEDFHAQ